MALPLLLEGKIALVTGSTRGIGWATARALAGQGATVIVNGRSNAGLVDERAAELAAEFGVPTVGFCFDVADAGAVKDCYQQIFKRFRRLDVLVNNAGILQDALLGMVSDDVIQRTLAVNLSGAIHNLQEASRLMSRNRSGSIVNMASIIGRYGNEGQAVYGASKAGVLGLTYSAAKELAPRNVRVNAIAPGFIDTDMVQQLPKDKFNERLRSIKMGRIGKPEEVANAILFLASDLSSYITGQVLGVDGGMVI
jgi:3-oxoacyl-[acyl-carrier protein] reductase